MKKYYFTFGQSHCAEDGTPMKDYYVTVMAPDYLKARAHFCQNFALPVMGMVDKWAFQYEEGDFDEDTFPAGEYAALQADPPTGDIIENDW